MVVKTMMVVVVVVATMMIKIKRRCRKRTKDTKRNENRSV